MGVSIFLGNEDRASWTYSHFDYVLCQLGLPSAEESDWAGSMDPEHLVQNHHKIVNADDRGFIAEIAIESLRSGSSISWE
jgi:hypothetical protein